MIEFHYESDFTLKDESKYADWLNRVIGSEDKVLKDLAFIFCDDPYLLNINEKYLRHEDYTDVITFDYSEGKQIGGDIFISIQRVEENAELYKEDMDEELRRVMVHGALHLMGYGDKEEEEVLMMRGKEEEKMKLFHVEQ